MTPVTRASPSAPRDAGRPCALPLARGILPASAVGFLTALHTEPRALLVEAVLRVPVNFEASATSVVHVDRRGPARGVRKLSPQAGHVRGCQGRLVEDQV